MGSITPINVVARASTSMPSERSMTPRGSATSISRIASAGTFATDRDAAEAALA
jgi:hypothetical protein